MFVTKVLINKGQAYLLRFINIIILILHFRSKIIIPTKNYLNIILKDLRMKSLTPKMFIF